jgi:TolB protein
MIKSIFRIFLGFAFFSVTLPSLAQFRVEVSGVGVTQLPIAVSTFRGQDLVSQKIAAIVQADLERSGQFRIVDAGGVSLDEMTRAMALQKRGLARQWKYHPLGRWAI